MPTIRNIDPMRSGSQKKRTYPRRRPDRAGRLNMEIFQGEDEELVLRAKHAAIDKKQPLRDWIFDAIRAKLARET